MEIAMRQGPGARAPARPWWPKPGNSISMAPTRAEHQQIGEHNAGQVAKVDRHDALAECFNPLRKTALKQQER